MLKVEHPKDYLKGVNSEIVDLLKEEQRIEQKAWKRKSILKRLKRYDDYDQEHSWQTLEDETEKDNYQYWLQQRDIAHIARTSYQYDHGYDEQGRQTQSETIFEICDLNTLNNQLIKFKDYVKNNSEPRPLTLIINLSAGHWVTLIVQHKLGHYYSYYSNSLGDKIQDNVESALRNKISANVKIFDLKIDQQVDGNNCGIFSLLNANKINELLKDNKPLDEVYKAIREIENSSDFLVGMRRSFSEELKKDSERLKTNIRDFALGHNIDIREISDSDINQPSQSNLKNSQELDQLFRKAIDKGYISIAAFAVKIGVSNDVIQNLSNDEKENFKKYMEKHDQQFSRDHQEIINLLKVEERSASSRQQSSSTLGQQKNREKPVDPAKSDQQPSESRIERSDSQPQPESSTQLEEFLLMLNNKNQLKKKYKRLTDNKKQELYALALFNNDERCLELTKFIENQRSSNAVRAYISRQKIVYNFVRNVSAFFGLRGIYENIYFDDIYKQIDAIHIIIGSYEKYKNEQSYKQYETYEQFRNDKNLNRRYALLDYGLEINAFSLISERIEKLKLKLKSEPLEELQFLLIRFKYFLENKEFKLPNQSETQTSGIFDNLYRIPIYVFFMYKQKEFLVKYLGQLSNKLKEIKDTIKQEVNPDKNTMLNREQLKRITGKINGENDYKKLYDDYWIFRDVDSLERIRDYMELVKLNKEKELEKLVIERVLQIIGEFLKSSDDSPYLSDKTRENLKKSGVPVEKLLELRDRLSHGFTLYNRINIENRKNDVFTEIKSELEEFEKTVVKVLNIVVLEQIKLQLDKASEFIIDGHDVAEVIEAKKGLEFLIGEKQKALLPEEHSENRFVAIERFNEDLNEKHNSKISDIFSKRLIMLKNILDSNQLKIELIEKFSSYNENLKPYHSKNIDKLIKYYKSDRKLKAAVEMLLLDLMTVLGESGLILKGLVIEDLPLSIGTWANASLRNYLGHGTKLLSSRNDKSEIIINSALKFINDEKEVTALVKLAEDDEIKKILFDAIEKDQLNEEWMNNVDDSKIKQKLNEHKDSITTIFKSPDYKDQLVSVLRSSNNMFYFIKRGWYRKVIDKLDKDQSIDVNAKDENGKTFLYYVLEGKYGETKKLQDLIVKLIEKEAILDDENILLLKKDNQLFNSILYAIVKENYVKNFKIISLTQKKEDLAKAIDSNGKSSLHVAAQAGSLDIVSYLVEKGIDLNILDNNRCTALHYAAKSGHSNIVSILIKSGAKYNIENNGEKTPLKLTEEALTRVETQHDLEKNQNKKEKLNGKSNNYKKIKELLDCTDKLFEAVQNNEKEEVNSLLEGKDPDTLKAILNARNSDGKTLIQAAGNEKRDIANLLAKKLKNVLSSDQQQETVQQGVKVSTKECLPSTSSGRRKREAKIGECEFSWEDVDEFNVEKDEKRDFSKIKIDSEKFVSYIKDLPKEKQSQLIQLASEVKIGGSSQGLVSKLIGNQKVMNHLGKMGKISGMTMHGMMAKNVLADLLNGNDQGVAVNVDFIAGGQLAAKVAEVASRKGLNLLSEGKALLGRSLRVASPFLARGTSAFVIYDLVNQIKALKNGTEEALVGVVGDSIYLGVDAAEIGVEVAEGFGVLEGVSSVTGPIGATIGAVVFVGTDIYMAVKRVDKIDQIIHLTGNEKFIEGLRAFIGIKPEQYIEELMEKKQLYNQLVKQGLEYLKQHNDIQSYVFPTGKSVVDSCRKKVETEYAVNVQFELVIPYEVEREECQAKFEEDLDSKVLLDRKRTGIRWSRARPDDLNEGRVFCLPQGNDEPAPDYGSYLCENAIGIFANKTGDHTLINLGEGKDYAKGFLNSPNIFVVNNGSKEYYGGNKDDIFVLQAEYIKGHLLGEGGINTLDTTLFALQEEPLNIQLETGEIADYFRDNWLKICEINKVIGRANKAETITVSCDGCNSNVKLIDGQSGNEEIKDRINIIDDSCDYQMQIVVRPNTVVYNRALKGSFDYLVPLNSSGSAELSFIYGPERFNVNNTFWFAYQAVDIKSIDVKYINVFNRTEHEIKFNFVESNKEFNVTISYSENPAYRLGKSGEIRIGNKGNLYMLENSDKSSEEVIRDYLPVANRVSKMSFFIQSVLSNETVVIGSGNHEVIHSNPAYRSHLVGNGGENVYVIDSETKEVIIHDVDEENSIDTIDLRNVVRKAKEVKVIKLENDLLLRAMVKEQAKYCTVRLKDGVERYNKTHVIVENVPMTISFDNNEWSLKPQPLMFEEDKEVILVTGQDVEEGSEIITPRKGGNYKFVRSNDNDLMITNAFDFSITKNDLCTITLSKFYETPRMKTLFIKFADKEIILKEHQEEISTARDINIVKREYKDQVYNDVFNPEVMMLSDQPVTHRHRHSRHREQARHRRSTTSSSTRPTAWINDLFGWVKSSISGLLSSKPESTKGPISQVDARVDVNGTIMLLDMLIRKVTGQKYVSTADQSISPLEAQGYALNITKGFEKV